jgi:hypothetical protein
MTGHLNDWHPPVMSILWGALSKLTGTPASLFWLQLVVIAFGVLVWSLVFIKWEMPAGTLLLLLGVALPSSLGFVGVLWKDVGMAFSLFTATGLIALANSMGGRVRQRWLLLGLAVWLLLYGLLVRSNALPALLPLVLLLVWSEARSRPVLATCLSAVVIAGVYLGASKTLQTLFKVDSWYPIQYVMLYDLAAIAKSTGDSRIPDNFKTQDFSLERLSENYRDWTGNYLFVSYDGFPSPPLRFVYRADQQDVLRRAWLDGIAAYPAVYLRNRWLIFNALMSQPGLLDVFPVAGQPTTPRGGFFLPGREWAVERVRHAIHFAWANTWLYNGWFWMSVLLVTIAGGWMGAGKYPGGVVAVGLGVSGLLYMAPYILIAPAIDFRYMYWCCIAGTMGSVIVAGMLLTELRTSPVARLFRR